MIIFFLANRDERDSIRSWHLVTRFALWRSFSLWGTHLVVTHFSSKSFVKISCTIVLDKPISDAMSHTNKVIIFNDLSYLLLCLNSFLRFVHATICIPPWRPKLSLFSSRYFCTIHRTRHSLKHSSGHASFKILWIAAALKSLRRKVSITKYCLCLWNIP